MIRGLRRRHRLVWAVLFPILAILLAAALLSRPVPPLLDALPDAREHEAESDRSAAENDPPASENEQQ